jgi:hypothetical protein
MKACKATSKGYTVDTKRNFVDTKKVKLQCLSFSLQFHILLQYGELTKRGRGEIITLCPVSVTLVIITPRSVAVGQVYTCPIYTKYSFVHLVFNYKEGY